MNSLWRTNKEITEIYRRNIKTVFRICVLYFNGNVYDAEDAVQTTFIKLIKDTTKFRSLEHEKAWLIVTASNVCRDILQSGWRKKVSVSEMIMQQQTVPLELDETFQCVMELPEKHKTAIYMYYYEGYSCKEIAAHLGKTESTVWRYLHEGRDFLKNKLKENEWHG